MNLTKRIERMIELIDSIEHQNMERVVLMKVGEFETNDYDWNHLGGREHYQGKLEMLHELQKDLVGEKE